MSGFLIRFTVAATATILIETGVLWLLLSRRHGSAARLFAGAWLSLCTLPVVWLVLPAIPGLAAAPDSYLLVAETLAPLGECGLFWLAFVRPLPADPRATARDWMAIVAANLASFTAGDTVWRLTGLA